MSEARRFATARDKDGNVVAEFMCPAASSDALSTFLRMLTFKLYALGKDERGFGGFGGAFGYGANFENDTFMMHRYCWCEKDGCVWCAGEAPNFHHKPSGLTVRWYKYIGRDNEMSCSDELLTLHALATSCLQSIGAELDATITEYEAAEREEEQAMARAVEFATSDEGRKFFDDMVAKGVIKTFGF